MVSCAVMGLLVLLHPLDWVSPVIPMLPMKLMDFVESPVPILVGLTVADNENIIDRIRAIFQQCGEYDDDECDDDDEYDIDKCDMSMSVMMIIIIIMMMMIIISMMMMMILTMLLILDDDD
jgi:uncharacterized protein YqhQ